MIKKCLIQVKNLFVYNFSFFAFINWCIIGDSKSRNIIYNYHPFFIGENDDQATESLILIRGENFKHEVNLENFKFNLLKDYYFLFKGVCVPFLRFFNYESNYLHQITKFSYKSKISKILLVTIGLIGIITIILIILSSSNFDLKRIDSKNWPIAHLNSDFTSFYDDENDKKAVEYYQNNLMGNIECLFDIIITTIFTATNLALTYEIFNKPGFSGIYITIFLGIFDIYILSSLIIKANFNYKGSKCLDFLFETWKNFDKIVNSMIRITILITKRSFLNEEKKKSIRDKMTDNYKKLRFIYELYFWVFILAFITFTSVLVIQTFIFINCSIIYDLFINFFFSSAIFINMAMTLGYIFLIPLTVLPFQFITCFIVIYLLHLKDKFFSLFKKNEKMKITPNDDISRTDSTKTLDPKNENKIIPKLGLESQLVNSILSIEANEKKDIEIHSDSSAKLNIDLVTEQKNLSVLESNSDEKKKLDIKQNENIIIQSNLEELKESLLSIQSKNKNADLESKSHENSLNSIYREKYEENSLTISKEISNDVNDKKNPASIFIMLSFPLISLALFCKIQYPFPLLMSAEYKKDSARRIAFGLPFLSLSYYSLLIERVPSKFDQALTKLRIVMKFIDSLF